MNCTPFEIFIKITGKGKLDNRFNPFPRLDSAFRDGWTNLSQSFKLMPLSHVPTFWYKECSYKIWKAKSASIRM